MSGKRGQSEMAKLKLENEQLRAALRIIHTWALVHGGIGLVPAHVRDLCAKALGKEPT